MKILKYELSKERKQTVKMPIHFDVLSVANEKGNLVLWAIVDESKEICDVPFTILQTGEEFEFDFIYSTTMNLIETVLLNDGNYVHVFLGL